MADIINTDNGSVAAGKVNDKLTTAIAQADHCSEWAGKVNAVTEAGYIDSTMNGSTFADKVADAGGVTPPSYTLRVLMYNLGHFSCGYAETSAINSSYTDGYPNNQKRNYATQLQRWTDKLDGINADLIAMAEFADTFGRNNGVSVSVEDCGAWDAYPYFSKGSIVASGWWYNVLCAKFPLLNGSNESLHSLSGASAAYVRVAEATIEGKTVKIGVTHLNWGKTQTHLASRTKEIKELIKLFQDDEYVILCGDFNTDGQYIQSAEKTEAQFMSGANEFDPFLYGFTEDGVTYEGGFTLANHGQWGDLKTCDATNSRPDHLTDSLRGNNNPDTFYNRPFCCLDNIIVKGFRMSNVMVIDDGYLTDHCGLICELTMID